MNIRNAFLVLVLLALSGIGLGCGKVSESRSASEVRNSSNTIARVYWQGRKKLGLKADAYYVNRIWSLPQTVRVESQALDRLSFIPWQVFRPNTAWTNIPAAAVRPLLDDVVQQECFFEMRKLANGGIESVFAINVDSARAGIWETNMAVVMASLTEVWPIQVPQGGGWRLDLTGRSLELTRSGGWTLIALGPGVTNALIGEAKLRIRELTAPFGHPQEDRFFEAEISPAEVLRAAGLNPSLARGISLLSAHMTGDGADVLTRANVTLQKPLDLALDDWNFPAALVREPIASFSAVRGIRPWINSSLQLQQVHGPNQLFLWSLNEPSPKRYLAAPLSGSNDVLGFGETLIRKANGWISAGGRGTLKPISGITGATWEGLPGIAPFLVSLNLDGGVVYAGTIPDHGGETNPPAPAAMFADIASRTNLIFYDWEMTGSRLVSDQYLGQIIRQMFQLPPLAPNSPAVVWLDSLVPRVNTCATAISWVQSNQVSIVRKSTVGFSAAELHLFASWLERPLDAQARP